MDEISLEWVHAQFVGLDPTHAPPMPEIQEQTLRMVRELVSDGLFTLTSPTGTYRHPRYTPWDLQLDAAMAKIEEAYVTHFDDEAWRFMCWLVITEKGKTVARELWTRLAHDVVRKTQLTESLQGPVDISEVHYSFLDWVSYASPNFAAVQKWTLEMIRELVDDGLFVLGVPSPSDANPEGFIPWDISLDDAMARIEDAYIAHFKDKSKWTGMAWLKLTDKGRKLALELQRANEPSP